MPRARHTPYSEPIAAEVRRRVRQGEALNVIGRDPAMPPTAAIHLWRRRLPGFAAELERAWAVGSALAGPLHRYSPALADAVCARVAGGESVAAICAKPQMPAVAPSSTCI